MVGRGIDRASFHSLVVNAATATSKRSHKTTPPVLLTESHIRLLIAVLGITLLVGNGITHQHSGAIAAVVRTVAPASPPFEEHQLFVLTGAGALSG